MPDGNWPNPNGLGLWKPIIQVESMYSIKWVGKNYPLYGAQYAILDEIGEIIMTYKNQGEAQNSSFLKRGCKIALLRKER